MSITDKSVMATSMVSVRRACGGGQAIRSAPARRAAAEGQVATAGGSCSALPSWAPRGAQSRDAAIDFLRRAAREKRDGRRWDRRRRDAEREL